MYPPQAPPQGYPPAQAAPQPVDRVIQGVLAQVEVRNGGWHRFHIVEPGNQYPTKVDTKKPDLIQQAMTLMGQPVAAKIKEQLSTNINEKTGRPFVNRYLNEIAPAGFSPGVQPNQGAPGPQGQVYQPPMPPQQPQYAQPPQPVQPQYQQPPTPTHSEPFVDERAMQIMRQAAAKVVGATWQMFPVEQQTAAGLIEACEVWMTYFVFGPLRFGIQPFVSPRQDDHTPGGGSEYNPAYASVGALPAMQQAPQQQDIFGAPMADGDPGPQDDQYQSLGQ